jgi:hypothetical protein
MEYPRELWAVPTPALLENQTKWLGPTIKKQSKTMMCWKD